MIKSIITGLDRVEVEVADVGISTTSILGNNAYKNSQSARHQINKVLGKYAAVASDQEEAAPHVKVKVSSSSAEAACGDTSNS